MGRLLRVLAVLVALGLVVTANYLRPIDAVAASPILPGDQRIPGQPPDLPWPVGGAAVAVPGIGLIGTHGENSPRPMASVAKVMAALVVVAGHPLGPIEQGPTVTVTADDFANYQKELAGGQSVVAVQVGEALTQRQLLEGMLIPSGNNFADLLARWDAGSVDGFVAKMNTDAARLGMRQSHFADPSGFSDQTVGTPSDLVLAGEALMADPVLAQIVGQGQVDLPVAGTSFNVDYALGSQGIVGIKTGSAPKAGACFLFAATAKVGGKVALVVGAVMDEPTLADAFTASEKLIAAIVPALKLVPAVSASEAVAEYRAPWGSRTGLIAQKDISLLAWPGMILHRRVNAPAVQPPLSDGQSVGSFAAWVGSGPPLSVPLATDGPLFEPGNVWRLTRPLGDTRYD
jgi:serine-type D-Ala-D-Ala carboxypeptidase (penicillin-binding protein 5/6)